MATKLQCEICGGKLIGKAGGLFECDSCGMEYDTTWVKEKIQEITGTVKVEGTVEVQGSVRVEGAANKDSLVKRGNMALEDGAWEEAKKYFNEALTADAECSDAYLGLALAERKLQSGEFISGLSEPEVIGFEQDTNFKRFMRFSSDEQKLLVTTRLEEAKDTIAKFKDAERVAFEKRAEPLIAARRIIAPAQGIISAGEYHSVGLFTDGTAVGTRILDSDPKFKSDFGQTTFTYANKLNNIKSISAGRHHTVFLHSDGTVGAVGSSSHDENDVHEWENIIAVSAGQFFTVGLKADGTVVATGSNQYGQCDVSEWTDIVAISAGGNHTLGLRSDGTVVGTGQKKNYDDYKGISEWKNIVAISAGLFHSVGLTADGIVYSTGNLTELGSTNNWKNIVSIACGGKHTVGLKADGTVVASGDVGYGQCDVSKWKNVVAIAAGYYHTLGLKQDGTVISTDYILKLNGLTSFNNKGQSRVGGWKMFESIRTLEQERLAAADRIELKREEEDLKQQEHFEALKREKTILQTELANLKGMFSGKRRKEIENRLAEIDAELLMLG